MKTKKGKLGFSAKQSAPNPSRLSTERVILLWLYIKPIRSPKLQRNEIVLWGGELSVDRMEAGVVSVHPRIQIVNCNGSA